MDSQSRGLALRLAGLAETAILSMPGNIASGDEDATEMKDDNTVPISSTTRIQDRGNDTSSRQK